MCYVGLAKSSGRSDGFIAGLVLLTECVCLFNVGISWKRWPCSLHCELL